MLIYLPQTYLSVPCKVIQYVYNYSTIYYTHSIQYTVYEGQLHNSLSIFFYWDIFEEMTSQQKPPLHILLGVSGSVAAIKLPQLVFELHNAFKTFGKTGFNVQIRVIVTKRGLYFLEKAEYYEGSMGLYEHFKNVCIPYRIYKQRKTQAVEMNHETSTEGEISEKYEHIQEQANEKDVGSTSNLQSEVMNEIILYEDDEEWESWTSLGDDVLHIALRNWADIFLIAPLSANTLAKLANGICDNLLTSVVRAWGTKEKAKPFLIAPAMNTAMWEHPLTYQQINSILQRNIYKSYKSKGEIIKHPLMIRQDVQDQDHENADEKTESEQLPTKKIKIENKQSHSWENQYRLIPPMRKLLACGDFGIGAMATIDAIISCMKDVLNGKEYPHYYIIEQNDLIQDDSIQNSHEDKSSIMKETVLDISGETCFHEGQLILRKYR